MPLLKQETQEELTESQRKNLELVGEVREFGKNLGLEFDGIFEDLEINPEESFVVYASYPDRLESPFSFWSYYNFFKDDEIGARSLAEGLKLEGLDVYISQAAAYGNECCPITPQLLEWSPEEVAHVTLHEATHIHNKNNGWNYPQSLEEAIADYVGFVGTLRFAEEKMPEMTPGARKNLEQKNKTSDLINRYLQELRNLYREGKPEERVRIFQRFEKEDIPEGRDGRAFNPTDPPFNNAYFLAGEMYNRHWPLVRRYMEGETIERYPESRELGVRMGNSAGTFGPG